MTERIIVGINGSNSSAKALLWAADRAARDGQDLLLVHVIDSSLTTIGNPKPLEAAEAWANELLQTQAAVAREHAPAAEVTTELHYGTSLPAIFEQLSEQGGLLVVGSDSTGGSEATLHGTGSLRVAAASKVPVVVVPDIDVTDRKGVVVGADGSEISKHAINFAAGEAARAGEPLIAVFAWKNDLAYGYGYEYTLTADYQEYVRESSQQELDLALAGLDEQYPGLQIQRVVAEGRPADALLQEAGNARLLVVGSHGRGAFRRLLLGSVSHAVLAQLVTPTAVVR